METTILLVLLCVVVAAAGAWQSVHCRHELEEQHRRRRCDP